jgi:translation initiation factor IF-2
MRHFRLTFTLATALVLGACSSSTPEQPLADDLQRDLAMTAGTAVELAPKAGGQQVVSALESTPAVPQPRTSQKAPRRSPTPAPQAAPAPVLADVTPEPEVEAPAPMVAPTPAPEAEKIPAPAPAVGGGRPTAVPSQRKAPAGGWKSPSDIIRNAPFPINP